MSEHVCEKKTKSALLSESSCSVLSEISGSETKQHSFHTELSPWQQIFLDWGKKGLYSAEVWAVLAVLAGLGVPQEEMGAVCRLFSWSERLPAPTCSVLWWHWSTDVQLFSQAAVWFCTDRKQKWRPWSADAQVFLQRCEFTQTWCTRQTLKAAGREPVGIAGDTPDVSWEEAATGAASLACCRLNHRKQCLGWDLTLLPWFVSQNTQRVMLYCLHSSHLLSKLLVVCLQWDEKTLFGLLHILCSNQTSPNEIHIYIYIFRVFALWWSLQLVSVTRMSLQELPPRLKERGRFG